MNDDSIKKILRDLVRLQKLAIKEARLDIALECLTLRARMAGFDR